MSAVESLHRIAQRLIDTERARERRDLLRFRRAGNNASARDIQDTVNGVPPDPKDTYHARCADFLEQLAAERQVRTPDFRPLAGPRGDAGPEAALGHAAGDGQAVTAAISRAADDAVTPGLEVRMWAAMERKIAIDRIDQVADRIWATHHADARILRDTAKTLRKGQG